MDQSTLLKNSIITGIELHAFFLLLIVLLYHNMKNSYIRNSKKIDLSLTLVYMGCELMVFTDCLWNTISSLTIPNPVVSYIVNLAYFFGSSLAAACWFIFCRKRLNIVHYKNKILYGLALIPYDIIMLLYILSPWKHYIFSIQGSEYIRGSLFYLDPLIKGGYIGAATVCALVSGNKKEIPYLRKEDYNLALFAAPVLICGVLQTIVGVSFNCLGSVMALILVYITGITNLDSDNTDSIYSLGNSFEATYIVNMDTGLIRPLHQDIMHSGTVPGMESNDFTAHFVTVLSNILLPEDSARTLEFFHLENVVKRFSIDNSFTLRYRVKLPSGETSIHTATFIKAMGNSGKQEFLLGINSVNSDSLIFERNEILAEGNIKLDKINSSIVDSVAKIVDSRDSESGEHIVRVKKFTEILAREVMRTCPEYKLDEEMIKIISSASVLHDVGKINIPDAILLKPGRLTDEEFEIMKTHTTRGCDILNVFPLGLDDAFLECALSICRWHHEKYDGKGYPDGLVGEAIPIAAQIVSVADCYDALVNDRPYKKAFTPEQSFEMIMKGDCGAFSPQLLAAFENQKQKFAETARLYK